MTKNFNFNFDLRMTDEKDHAQKISMQSMNVAQRIEHLLTSTAQVIIDFVENSIYISLKLRSIGIAFLTATTYLLPLTILAWVCKTTGIGAKFVDEAYARAQAVGENQIKILTIPFATTRALEFAGLMYWQTSDAILGSTFLRLFRVIGATIGQIFAKPINRWMENMGWITPKEDAETIAPYTYAEANEKTAEYAGAIAAFVAASYAIPGVNYGVVLSSVVQGLGQTAGLYAWRKYSGIDASAAAAANVVGLSQTPAGTNVPTTIATNNPATYL